MGSSKSIHAGAAVTQNTNALFDAGAAISINGNNVITVGTNGGALCTLAVFNISGGTPACTVQTGAEAITAVSVNVLSPANVGYLTTVAGVDAYGAASGVGPYTGNGLVAGGNCIRRCRECLCGEYGDDLEVLRGDGDQRGDGVKDGKSAERNCSGFERECVDGKLRR